MRQLWEESNWRGRTGVEAWNIWYRFQLKYYIFILICYRIDVGPFQRLGGKVSVSQSINERAVSSLYGVGQMVTNLLCTNSTPCKVHPGICQALTLHCKIFNCFFNI